MGKNNDAFYTTEKNVNFVIDKIKELYIEDFSEIEFLEPSAGNGAFSNKLPNCLAYDIEPKGEGIIRADFLKSDLRKSGLVTVGNPPFGKRSKLAIDFVNKSAEYSDLIVFILPNQFLKYNTQNKIRKDLKLTHTFELPEETFLIDGEEEALGIRCVLQFWVKENSEYDIYNNQRILERPSINIPEEVLIWQHNGTKSSMKNLDEDWDIALYRQGYKDYDKIFIREEDYDFIKERMENSSDQFFFIKYISEESPEIVSRINFEELAYKNTTTPGFGKADFVQEYKNNM